MLLRMVEFREVMYVEYLTKKEFSDLSEKEKTNLPLLLLAAGDGARHGQFVAVLLGV